MAVSDMCPHSPTRPVREKRPRIRYRTRPEVGLHDGSLGKARVSSDVCITGSCGRDPISGHHSRWCRRTSSRDCFYQSKGKVEELTVRAHDNEIAEVLRGEVNKKGWRDFPVARCQQSMMFQLKAKPTPPPPTDARMVVDQAVY